MGDKARLREIIDEYDDIPRSGKLTDEQMKRATEMIDKIDAWLG